MVVEHLICSVSTNAALIYRAPVDDMCKVATCSSLLTFVKHYRLNLYGSAEAAFCRRVLWHNIPEESNNPPRYGTALEDPKDVLPLRERTDLWILIKIKSNTFYWHDWILIVKRSSLRQGGHLALPLLYFMY